MNVLLLTMFVSLGLVLFAVLLFVWLTSSKVFEHSDRLALLPLDFAPEAVRVAEVKTAEANTAREDTAEARAADLYPASNKLSVEEKLS